MKNKKYENYISLGYFCGVATDLEILGLRSYSYPFDWLISSFPEVVNLIDKEFDGFLDFDNLSQNTCCRSHYRDDKFKIYFFHDFSEFSSLNKQYSSVKSKYLRRISRFLQAIKKPTLFFRYISSEEKDERGMSRELLYIEDNYDEIINILKRYNKDNQIIFLGDETLKSNKIEIFVSAIDDKDIVSRHPILKNDSLCSFLKSVEYSSRMNNLQRHKKKSKRKKSFFVRAQHKFVIVFRKLFFRKYAHERTYTIVGK